MKDFPLKVKLLLNKNGGRGCNKLGRIICRIANTQEGSINFTELGATIALFNANN